MTETLNSWIEHEYRQACIAMLRSVSPVEILKSRPGFGQIVHAARGAIVASPVLAAYDPEPDYFFHWYRDSAVVVDALRHFQDDAGLGGEALAHLADFVRFSLSLQGLDGHALVADSSWRKRVAQDFRQYLRSDADLASVHGDAVAADTRVNPDGTLDISKWNRPQHDGPPLRALALLRWARSTTFDARLRLDVSTLLRADLEFTFGRWQQPSFDIWEEEHGLHYYTLRVAAAALDEGANWLQAQGEPELERRYRAEALTIARRLDGFWLPGEGYYRSRVLSSGERSAKELDIAVVLAAIHADAKDAAHSVHDPRMQATLDRLDALFDATYAINRNRPAHTGTAMGRYAGDAYYSGGAYYFSTLGAAEFCFRAGAGAPDTPAWVQRGDAYLATVRAYTPASGELSEQFDQTSGEQTSARHLAWSYAAFISCIAARRAVSGSKR